MNTVSMSREQVAPHLETINEQQRSAPQATGDLPKHDNRSAPVNAMIAGERDSQQGNDEIDRLTELRRPTPNDGAQIHSLIAICKPLDLNSTYAYLLLCHHYADTCVVARSEGRVTGFISGYIPPRTPNTLFVWQVAVRPEARGTRLGVRMLTHLLMRDTLSDARFLETTVSPSNLASRRMFQRFAEKIAAPIEERTLFDRTAFGGEDHEEEVLLKIGPFVTGLTGKETP